MTALWAIDCEDDGPAILIPHPESHFVLRIGPMAHEGIEVHAFGARDEVRRKVIHRGQKTVTARLRLGASEVVLGASASAIAGRIVPLEDLWGSAATRRLYHRLADTQTTEEAAAILDQAIAERIAMAGDRPTNMQLVLTAANKLGRTNVNNVNQVATDLGMSERHLRRIFRDTIGMSPKAFAKLARFHIALRAARAQAQPSWANIAAEAGYYDQAHLIADFRAIAGVTPRAFVGELRAAPSVG